jgi:excisionase family DNA binding protein
MAEKTTKRKSRIRPSDDSDFLDVKQAASYCGFGVRTLYDLANRQQVPAHRIGRTLRFSRSALDQWNWQRSMANVDREG